MDTQQFTDDVPIGKEATTNGKLVFYDPLQSDLNENSDSDCQSPPLSPVQQAEEAINHNASNSSPLAYDETQDLRPDEIRWLYKNDADKKWTPFTGFDSLRIELEYRRQGRLNCKSVVDNQDVQSTADSVENAPEINNASSLSPSKTFTSKQLSVTGGLFEVDFDKRKCVSIYWKGESFPIMRGTWFYDGSFQPLEEAYAEIIEKEHLDHFVCLSPVETFECTPYSIVTNGATKNTIPGNDTEQTTEAATSIVYETESETHDKKVLSPKVARSKSIYTLKNGGVVHTYQFPQFHIDWHSSRDIYLFSEATPSKLVRTVSQRLGLQKSGYKLRRGYLEVAATIDKPADITHIVFVIHGVGHKMDAGRIIRNCSSLRANASWLKQKYFNSQLTDSNERSEFFPVDWRSALKLDCGTVDAITIHRVRGLRETLNSSLLDVLYYTSPLFRTEIVNALREELNRLYEMFCERNPNFIPSGGKVSVLAHSLGCVITYDILTGWSPIHMYDQYVSERISETVEQSDTDEGRQRAYKEFMQTKNSMQDLEEKLLYGVKPNKTLDFKIENLFCLGSPLSLFLALRGFKPKFCTSSQVSADCLFQPSDSLVKRFFNIYHPADPVAYRLEPLLLKHYQTITPLQIHYYGTADKQPYELMKAEVLPHGRNHASTVAVSNQPFDKGFPNGILSKSVEENGDYGKKSQDDLVLDGQNKPMLKSESKWFWGNWMRTKKDPGPAISFSSQFQQELKVIQQHDLGPGMTADHSFRDQHNHHHSLPSLEGLVFNPLTNTLDSPDGSKSPIESDDSLQGSNTTSPEPTDLEFRLDYMLRESNIESYSPYLSAMTAHTSYWTSYDVVYFVLSYVHGSLPPTSKDKECPYSYSTRILT